MRSFRLRKDGGARALKRFFLIQIVPFVLMLLISSWLALQAGALIDQQKSKTAPTTVLLAQIGKF